MKKSQEFYYNFKPVNAWLFFNILFTVGLFHCVFCWPSLILWRQTQVLAATFLFSWGLWGYKYLKKHRVALITDESISIDHCEKLYWKDVKWAEERVVRCCFHKMKIIVLIPRKNIKYNYNFLQKHNGEFTPFSLPLYDAVSQKDAKKMTKLVEEHVKLKRLKQQEAGTAKHLVPNTKKRSKR